MQECYPGIEHTQLFDLIQDCLDNGQAHYLNNEFQFPDGSTGYFRLIIQPVPEGVAVIPRTSPKGC